MNWHSMTTEKTAQTLKNKGIRAVKFVSKQLDEKLLKDALAIVCMTDKQRDVVRDLRFKAGVQDRQNDVYSFFDIAGYQVIDPYGKGLDCYEYVYGLLDGGMDALIDKILPENIRHEYVAKPKNAQPKNKTKAEQISLF